MSLCSGHQLGAAPASPSGCHPHGSARGPPPPPPATAAAGVLAVAARSAAGPWAPGRSRHQRLDARAAAAAGATVPEAEAADPEADSHR